MRYTSLFLVLFITFQFTACEEPVDETAVIARFIAIGENGFAPATIEFKEDDTNGSEFEWIFHDGVSYKARSIKRTYEEEGNYPVKLIVRKFDNVDSITLDIGTRPRPTKISVTEIKLLEAPFINNSSPDIYIKMEGQGATKKTEIKNSIRASDLPITWTFSEPYPSFPFTNLNNQYYLQVRDNDQIPSGLISISGFRASEFIDPYRNTILVNNLNGTQIQLSVIWGN